MNLLEAFKIAFSAIWSNKMRSLLTMLGLIIGISSVVTIVSIGNGTQDQMMENFESLGTNRVSISEGRHSTLTPSEKLTIADMDLIRQSFKEEVETITPKISKNVTIVENIDDTSASLTGVSKDSEETLDLELLSGRFINEFDIESRKDRIVIDSDIAEGIFGSTDVVGEKILFSFGKTTKSLQVVGVYEAEESLSGFSTVTVYAPYTTIDKLFNGNGVISGIEIGLYTGYDKDVYESKILSLLERRHGNEGEDKYSTFSAEDMAEMVSDTLGTMTLFVSAIAGISLVVGGIGIMNIMLVSVTERTREIGIRKALGATRKNILTQFLIEAVTVSMLGGFLGALVGFGLTSLVASTMDLSARFSYDSLLLAVGFSASIGIFFGIYPANKAAKLDPIEALRYE
jgi:putative ABC transport system permease protein